jgi:hypothetical protein
MNEELKNALEILQTRLAGAQTKRSNLEIDLRETEAEITNLNQAINRILLVLGFEQGQPLSELGITDAIRRVAKSQAWMSAREVHEALEKQGFNLSAYENPMASIYKILTRLAEAGELENKKDGWNAFYKAKRLKEKGKISDTK